MHANSINELKKMDLFDLGVVLTICCTGGLDMVNEEHLARLTDFTQHCCLFHALKAVDPMEPGFDHNLLSTLLSLRKILGRISAPAQDFICLCMQQRFTEQEMQQRGLLVGQSAGVTANNLLNSPWILNGETNSAAPKRSGAEENGGDDDMMKLSIKELLNVSSDWKDVNNLRGGAGGAGGFPGQEPLS